MSVQCLGEQHGPGICDTGAVVRDGCTALVSDCRSEVLGRNGEIGGLTRSCAGFLHAEECGASTGVGDVGSGEACGGCGEFGGEVASVDVRC